MGEAKEFIVAVMGITSGFIIPLGVFFWLYKDAKNKRAAIVEIAKTANAVSYTHLTLPTTPYV